MIYCYYGCGQEAKHYLKTVNKWCCNKKWQQCPIKRKNNSDSKKGRIPWNRGVPHTKDELNKQSISMKNKWKDPNYFNKQKETRKTSNHKTKARNSKIGIKNPNYGKPIHPNTLKASKLNEQKIKERYPKFVEVEKPVFDLDGNIKVKCKYCEKLFVPSRSQLFERMRNLKVGLDRCSLFCCVEHQYLSPFCNKTDPKELSDYQKYYRKVLIETGKNLRLYGNKINNLNLRGIKHNYQLDHKYSIKMGFKNNIDPKIIGNWKNLEIISTNENIHKKIKCSISLEQLVSNI